MASANEQAALLQQILGLTPVQQDYPLQDVMNNISRLPAGKKVPVPIVPKKAPIEVDRKSVEDQAFEAKALTDVITPKSVWPLDQNTFNQLLSRTTPALSSQRQGISDLEKQISGYDTSINPWLAGAGAVSDILGGTDNLSSLMAQKEKKELNKVALSEKLQSARDKLSDKEMDLLKAQFQNPFAMQDKSQLGLMTAIMGLSGKQQSNELGALVDIFKAASRPDKVGKSAGQDALDRKFADQYINWRLKGGSAAFKKNYNALTSALAQLEANPDMTGTTFMKLLPREAVSKFASDSATVQQLVTGTIIDMAKKLGVNPTDTDLKRIEETVWDKDLPVASNIQKVKAYLMEQSESAKSLDSSSDWYETHGKSLADYVPTKSSGNNAPSVGTIKNGYKFKGGNPADKNNWEKQ